MRAPLRYVLIGDGQSPHLLKWAKALATFSCIELWVASSRGFMYGFDDAVPSSRRLALGANPKSSGGNIASLRLLPALGKWLKQIDADWLHAHYLTSHGTLAWLAKRMFRLRGQIVGSAWGSDILVAPERSLVLRWVTQSVLRACSLTTSDSNHMAKRMRELGAGEVMTFPFGLEEMPTQSGPKEPWIFFANRGLEPLYRPELTLIAFARVAALHPDARLAVANGGSLEISLPTVARSLGLTVGSIDTGCQVQFMGRLDTQAQARLYERARWYISLPETDSISVSVLEAMAYGCVPMLSDLPANRELISDGINGVIISDALQLNVARLEALLCRADQIAQENRTWIAQNGLFSPAVARFLEHLKRLTLQECCVDPYGSNLR